MNNSKKIKSAIEKSGDVMQAINLMDCEDAGIPHAAMNNIIDIRKTLEELQEVINMNHGKTLLAEAGRDSLLMAIAGTEEGRFIDITEPLNAVDAAIRIVRLMDQKAKCYENIDEIPFGAVEQDTETASLQRRIDELEVLLELKTDELRHVQTAYLESVAKITSEIAFNLGGWK